MTALMHKANGGLDTAMLDWDAAPNSPQSQPTYLDLEGTEQATAGLNLNTVAAGDMANFQLLDGHTITFKAWATGVLTGTLTETVSVSAVSGLDAHGNLTGAITEQLTASIVVTDGLHRATLVVTDTIALKLAGTGYTGSGVATSIAAATTAANGVSEANGQTVHAGAGSGTISGVKVDVSGAPTWSLAFLSQQKYAETLTVTGTETLAISATLNAGHQQSAATSQVTDLAITANTGVGIVGVATDEATHHSVTVVS